MSETRKLFESFKNYLNETDSLEFFKTDGLNIACNVCIDNGDTNTNCDKVSKEVVKAALDRGIDCKVVQPFTIARENSRNGHYAILVGDKIVDYCIKQFVGDNKTCDYNELAKNADNIFAISATSFKPVIDDELKNASHEKIFELARTLDLIVEII